MPLDPQAKAALDALAAINQAPYETMSPEQARALSEARPKPRGPELPSVRDLQAKGPAGDLHMRVFTPEGTGPLPALVWFHGGGWVIGSVAGSDGQTRTLAKETGCVVVSVEYRLAPEAKFPGPVEDCYAATAWVAANSQALGVDARRIAVGGDSAGGNLAAAAALMARDRGGPSLRHQLLVYPVIERNFATQSYRENGSGYLLSRSMMEWFWDHYMRTPSDAEHPYLAPIRAASLHGLPPATVITAEFDPLRDEGEMYARALQAAGVPTTCTRYPGMIHGFFGMYHIMDQGKKAMADAGAALRKAMAG
ncbi:MAG: alpha/beta hydrolase [Dehalococcoidia bacterium]|nr:alpha/beta hydrolase [Dehalococcoidia bacterium]